MTPFPSLPDVLLLAGLALLALPLGGTVVVALWPDREGAGRG